MVGGPCYEKVMLLVVVVRVRVWEGLSDSAGYVSFMMCQTDTAGEEIV